MSPEPARDADLVARYPPMAADPAQPAESVAGPWPICRRCDGILLGAVPHDHAAHRIALRAWRRRQIDGQADG